MKLSEIKEGQEAVITSVKGEGAFRKRLLEMGIITGEKIKAVKKSPMKDPVEYRILDYDVSLRNTEADLIEVTTDNKNGLNKTNYKKLITERKAKTQNGKDSKVIKVALIGNPNCGKSSIFNHTSGEKAKVGNYCGVTVESKEGEYKYGGYTFKLIDLPGTYSVSSYSPDELYVRDYLLETGADIVVNVLDSSNLKRNLYLTTQLMDLNVKIVGALNMYDSFSEKGLELKIEELEKVLNIPFVPTVATKGKGINELFKKIIEVSETEDKAEKRSHIYYGRNTEEELEKFQKLIRENDDHPLRKKISSRFLAVKLMEKDKDAWNKIKELPNSGKIEKEVRSSVNKLEAEFDDDTETLITDIKYRFIIDLLNKLIVVKSKKSVNIASKFDSVLTHKFLGFPIFLGFIWLTFFATFNLGEYPMGWIEIGVQYLSNVLSVYLTDGIFKDFLISGLIGGVGSVLVFLPNIVILYIFISILEDSGYMARAVFLMDKLMSKIGLNGKAFIPLLMGFGCNVPAIMSTRIIEGHKDRLITMLINPFMSCSARLTVYVLFISAFFVEYQALILFSLYMTGIIMAVASALIFRKTFFKASFIPIPFIMEFPRYKVPTVTNVWKSAKFSSLQYLKKLGGVILIASTIIWALGYFPKDINFSKNYEQEISSVQKELKLKLSEKNYPEKEEKFIRSRYNEKVETLRRQREAEQMEKSYIGQIGRAMLPVMEPLGFDWKMSVGIVAGVAAKEVVIGTLGVLYQAEPDAENNDVSLVSKMQNQIYLKGEKAGQKVFTPLVAFSFMIFILIYFPCIGVIAAIRKESGTKRWAVFAIVYPTALAWIMSFIVYNGGQLIS